MNILRLLFLLRNHPLLKPQHNNTNQAAIHPI